MKIVRPGLNRPDWTTEVTCKGDWNSGCGAVLEVGLSDLYTQHKHDIGGARTSAHCACPACGTRIEIHGVTAFVTTLPTCEEWEAANPDLVASMEKAGGEIRAMREAAKAKYGEREY